MTQSLRRFVWPLGVAASITTASFVYWKRSDAESAPPTHAHHRVVVVGGGTGGVTVAAQLKRSVSSLAENNSVAIIDASSNHYYQPGWTLVGGGLMDFADTKRSTRDLIPNGVQWHQTHVSQFDPEHNRVTLSDGRIVSYDYLVIATGLVLHWDAVKGMKHALDNDLHLSRGVCSIYDHRYVHGVFNKITALSAGNAAIFTQPSTPIKCGGAPQKIMYLTEDYLKRNGKRDGVSVSFVAATLKLFAVDFYCEALMEICKQRKINTMFGYDLVEIRGDEHKAVFLKKDDQSEVVMDYDMLHVVPLMTPPKELTQSPLAAANGYCDVDQYTLQHNRYSNVFAIGDSANLPTSKTAAAISSQAPVLVHNLERTMSGKNADARYNGYTSCPIVTGKGKLVLAEFLYGGVPAESFPFDQRKERLSMYMLKRYFFPWAYWNLFLTGRWYGPNHLVKPNLVLE